jgi:hypothetical protein
MRPSGLFRAMISNGVAPLPSLHPLQPPHFMLPRALLTWFCRCLDFLARHVAEFSLQQDQSDTSCPHTDVAIARVWLSAVAPHDLFGHDGDSCIAATYVVAYDLAFSCPVHHHEHMGFHSAQLD